MGIIRGIIGLAFIAVLSLLLSSDRSKITSRIKQIAIMIALQLVLTFVCLRTTFGITLLENISNFMSWLIGQAQAGVDFVFGGIKIEGGFVFFFNVLLPLVFMSALIGILDYIKVLPFFMKWIGIGINKLTGVGELESQFAIATTLLGQPAGYLTITEPIKKIDQQRMFTLVMSATSTTGASMLAAYMELVKGEYVVVAVLLNIFSGFIISSIINPYDPQEKEAQLVGVNEELEDIEAEKTNFFDMLGTYISNGFNLACAVAGVLVGFIALIAFLNNSLEILIGITFTDIMGYVFSPIAFAIGVPNEDIVNVGGIMATKLFTNELVAMNELNNVISSLSAKSIAMISAYLISFANFGSIGIVTGALKAIDERQAKNISELSMKLIGGATLASLLTATIVGFFF